jgi:hypothetical protein
MEILLNISEIAIITGDNPYKKKEDYIIELWKKYANEDYQKYKLLTKFSKETDIDKVKKIYDINKCSNIKNTIELESLKKDISKKIAHLPEDEKKDIIKSINNVTNSTYGNDNENDVTKLYEKISGNKITKTNKYHKKLIYESDTLHLFIGGKIDGINNETGDIIEVKNRVHKLFYTLRDYEKVQIICYMYLFNSKRCDLVEAYKGKKGTEINIINVDFDEKYINKILKKVVEFTIFFENFLQDDKQKIDILQL